MSIEDIGRDLRVRLKDGSTVEGECYTFDPATRTLVILEHDCDKCRVRFVLSHAITNVDRIILPDTQVSSDVRIKRLEKLLYAGLMQCEKEFSAQEISDRKKKLKSWLDSNRVPTEEIDNSSLSLLNGIVFVDPPYLVSSCRSSNTIVLDRILGYIKSCPGLECGQEELQIAT